MKNTREIRILADCLVHTVSLYPDKTALITGNDSCTYTELFEASKKIAASLKSHNVKRGDRVVLFLDNTKECVISLWGVILADAVFVIINPQTKVDKLVYILNDADATVLITEKKFKHIYLDALKHSPFVKLVISTEQNTGIPADMQETYDSVYQMAKHCQDTPRAISVDLAALIYTSGSTGDPKGVMMSHQSMVFTCESLLEYLQITSDDRIINLMPLAFDYGLYQLLMSVRIGATLVLERSFAYPAQTIIQIQKEAISVFPGVPTIFMTLIAMNKRNSIRFDSVTCVTNTAAALPPEAGTALKEIFPNARIFRMYGLTECKRVCYLPPEYIDLKPKSVGIAIPGTEAFVLDSEGNRIKPGESGILHVRGAHVMLGYWKKPELTQLMIKNGTIPGDRILCSQDYFTIDNDNFLYFLGRSDDIIKTQGQKVSPIEIENCLYEITGILEAAVIGVPDNIQGESIYAFVHTIPGMHISEMEIRRYCREKLENFMIPKAIRILDTPLPKTTTGKIMKKALRKPL